ncbi:uncharacterized protein [Miscanthus floridulus]|uniref:uncharacterized protein n=1 Tax=Miscanthus floridulus TaxID=154761 RepID=UPI0034591A1B
MFEGVVSQVLDGLLRRYVKGIQKEQLKIGIWKEEILLENVELILEAFDYLQAAIRAEELTNWEAKHPDSLEEAWMGL